jgi:hypothetical protein
VRPLTFFLLFTCTLAFGQSAPPNIRHGLTLAGEPLPANYQLTLELSENDQPASELSFVVATTEFTTDWVQPKDERANVDVPTFLRFTGSLAFQEDGSVLVRYKLGAEVAIRTEIQSLSKATVGKISTPSIQFKTNSTEASARLKLNERFQILKIGSRTYRLTVSPAPR